MARNTTKPGLEECDDLTFLSPLALSLRIATQRRGISEAEARQIYLDYLNRAEPDRRRKLA